MSEPTRGLRAIVLGAIVLCIVASLTGAKAGQDKNGGLRIATVDPVTILTQAANIVATKNQLQKQQSDTLLRLQTWQQNPLLSEADQVALSDIALAEATTNGASAQQKSQKDKLTGQSKTLVDEFNSLQSKQAALTQAEKDRLNVLTRAGSDTESRINLRKRESDEDLQKQANALDAKASKDMKDSINKVAKDKGFNLVFRNDVAFYADNDITDAVLAQMNKLPK